MIGGSRIDDTQREQARDLGAGLAELSVALVCGGLGGSMAAVCEGYREADGPLAIGILPGSDRAAANPHVDVAVATGIGHARNALVAMNGDAVVALPGGPGTLSEVGLSRIFDKPVVAVDAWQEVPGVETVANVDEAVKRVGKTLGL